MNINIDIYIYIYEDNRYENYSNYWYLIGIESYMNIQIYKNKYLESYISSLI